MEESIVSRLARALEAFAALQESNPGGLEDYWHEAARDAIAAIREPTETMQDAGGNCGGFEFDGESGIIYPAPIWRAMIDAALKE